MKVLQEVPNFESLVVAKRQARVSMDGTVRVWELDYENNTLRHYTTHIDKVTYPAIKRAYRKERTQEYINVPVMGEL